ncbi:MAG: four helix bundle protein [Bacteroidetes bacterium]|nr:four helix bundle protein [Bacteroidota bacterium]
MQNFKELKVWSKSHEFTLTAYKTTQTFPSQELFGLTSQLRRSAFSIAANIAEGCGKNSNNKLAHYLNIALGSSNESEYYIILAKDLKYLNDESFEILDKLINEIKGMLIKLILKVRGNA